MKIAIFSNINLNSIIEEAQNDFDVYKVSEHNAWFQEIMDLSSNLYRFRPECVFLILDGNEIVRSLDNSKKVLHKYLNCIEDVIKSNSDIKFFISSLDISSKNITDEKCEDENRMLECYWIQGLNNLKVRYRNTFILDLKKFIEEYGRREFYSKELWYFSREKFSKKGQQMIKDEIESLCNSVKGKRKKCIILDINNVFIKHAIKGSEFKKTGFENFEKRIKEIKDTGIMLSICSKNNVEDINNLFLCNRHGILRKSDFASIKFNWNSKVTNIKEICSELNIGTDSVVFISDNSIESELVKTHFNGITVQKFPNDIFELEDFIIDIYNKYFRILKTSNEDLMRTEMYMENAKREEQKKEMESLDKFLKNLDMEITVRKANSKDTLRISQLTQKTNQFNLTNRRYGEAEINKLIKNNNFDVFAVEVKDKFGDNGMASVIVTKRKNKKQVVIDMFLMSCRVMGRKIEEQLMNFVEEMYRQKGCEEILAYYNYSKKNKPVERFYESMGYNILSIDKSGNKFYMQKLSNLKGVKRKIYGKLIYI
ncbi:MULTISPECIES: HAD-IIIC family phosphatase [Clostridium]|uniref:HAD-IIIC family phosphatase n=1 Tax=Clostridium TaxID=1485 RepID=UPI000826B83C|nr:MULTISPECIES: HAD family hydrolase [Clostridium]PJI08688.1 hypothetical protein CUB90_12795 [Clostridium sp. CT7]